MPSIHNIYIATIRHFLGILSFMNTSTHPLFRQFSSALAWNALAYTAHKSAFTIRTFLLYRFLSPSDFSTWATTNSALFLLLLWLDLGLRKSIPRYAPFFRSNCRQVTKQIMILQQTILIILHWPFSRMSEPTVSPEKKPSM